MKKGIELQRIIDQLHTTVDFAEVDFSDVNACALDGDNALHCVTGWGDVAAARILIAHGIDVNKAGDLGYTPLHVACMKGNMEMVKLLIENGADLFAQSDGDLPFTTARRRPRRHLRFSRATYGEGANAGAADLDSRAHRSVET